MVVVEIILFNISMSNETGLVPSSLLVCQVMNQLNRVVERYRELSKDSSTQTHQGPISSKLRDNHSFKSSSGLLEPSQLLPHLNAPHFIIKVSKIDQTRGHHRLVHQLQTH